MKRAFTLAEVLITLGVIGVVAAMTMPVLLQLHTNRVVETRLAKFYSTINQAIKLAENEYGEKEIWYDNKAYGMELDENGEPIQGTSLYKNWFDKYLGKYLVISKTEIDDAGRPTFYFDDGTALQLRNATSAYDYNFYVTNPKKCINKYKSLENAYGKCAFIFIYAPLEPKTFSEMWIYHVHKGVEPYKFNWDGTKEGLFTGNYGCNIDSTYKHYCTALIQYNGWKIPKEYPFRVSY